MARLNMEGLGFSIADMMRLSRESYEEEISNLREALEGVIWLYQEGDGTAEQLLKRAYLIATDTLKETN